MEQLTDFIRSQINIDDKVLEHILSNFKERVIAKDKFALKKGQIATEYFFIQSGGLRIYLDDQDRQVTAWIALENNFFTELSSLNHQTPTRFNIQAIEDTVLLTINKDKMEGLYQQFPEWQQFGRQIWETAFLKIIDGIIAFQTMTAEERYLMTMQGSELLNRIPLKDLASFLGITPTSLSRLRKTIR
jgi:CRP-like cAMP-binding protein